MLRFYAAKFVSLMTALDRIERMHLEAHRAAAEVELELGYKIGVKRDTSVEMFFISDLDPMLVDISSICSEIGLNHALKQVNKMQAVIAKGKYMERPFRTDLDELKRRVEEDLEDRMCLIIPQNVAEKYYENQDCLGLNVIASFPSLRDEIEEAGSCFATARYTGSVVHLARILEAGIFAYAGWLDLPVVKDKMSWGSLLSETYKKIGEKTKGGTWADSEHETFARSCQAFFSAAKTAFRDPSTHIVRLYDEPKAKRVFNTVEAFMSHLSEHLDESGTFRP